MGICARAEGFDGERVVEVEAPQIVDDGHLIVGDVVHSAEVGQPVELQARVAEQVFGKRAPVARVNVNARMFVGGEGLEDLCAELIFKNVDDLLAGHAMAPALERGAYDQMTRLEYKGGG